MTITMRFIAARVAVLLAAWLLVGWTVEPVFAQSSRDRDSSRNSRERSSRMADDDDDFDDDDDRDSRRSRSARSSRESTSSSSSRARSSARSSSSRRSATVYQPPAIVFGASYERVGVRPRGNIHSVEAFEAFDCTVTAVQARGTTFYRCADAWFNRVEHEGWITYSEVFPPAGLSVAKLPNGAQPVRAGTRTLYATSDAFYEAVRDAQGTRYVVVEPEIGTVIESLPASAKHGIPVRAGRNDYYRHLGVFYREEATGGAKRYVAAVSPFAAPSTPVVATGR